MPTVSEILKQTGMTDEQIAALDEKVLSGFTAVVSQAEQDRQAAATAAAQAEQDRLAAKAAQETAELERRSNIEFYETKIVPSLTGWDEEQAKLRNEITNHAAEAAYYKTLIDKAKEGGFVPPSTQPFTPAVPTPNPNPSRDNNGRFVPGPTGSPEFKGIEDLRKEVGSAFGIISDIQWKHQSLFNQPMPISPTQLIQEAEQQKLDPMAYASRRFNFQAREQEIAAQKAKEHDAQIAAAAMAEEKARQEAELAKVRADYEAKLKSAAESRGNNPDVHAAPGSSKFSEIRRATEEGARPDPLKMNDAERRAATRRTIHEEISANSAEAAVA